MTSPATSPEQQLAIEQLFNGLNEAGMNALLQNPFFQDAISSAVANGVDEALAAKELDSKPDFVLAYDDLTTEQYKDLVKNPNPDNEAYENRVQHGREGVDNHANAVNIWNIITNNEKPEPAKKRPYGAILRDLKDEKSLTGIIGAKKVSATDTTKVDSLMEELAARLTLEPTDYSRQIKVKTPAGYDFREITPEDTRLEIALGLQKRGNLTDDELITILDQSNQYEEIMITIDNKAEVIIVNTVLPALEIIVGADGEPNDFFFNKDGTATDAYIKVDEELTKLLDEIDNPLIREKVLRNIDKDLQETLDVANGIVIERRAANPVPIPTVDKDQPLVGQLLVDANKRASDIRKLQIGISTSKKILKKSNQYEIAIDEYKKLIAEEVANYNKTRKIGDLEYKETREGMSAVNGLKVYVDTFYLGKKNDKPVDIANYRSRVVDSLQKIVSPADAKAAPKATDTDKAKAQEREDKINKFAVNISGKAIELAKTKTHEEVTSGFHGYVRDKATEFYDNPDNVKVIFSETDLGVALLRGLGFYLDSAYQGLSDKDRIAKKKAGIQELNEILKEFEPVPVPTAQPKGRIARSANWLGATSRNVVNKVRK